MSRTAAGREAEVGPGRRPGFTFAVIGDTHIQPESGDEPLLWPVYGLANGRARYVVGMLNRAAPAFTVHLGDFIHPLPTAPAYGAAARLARDVLGRLDGPLHGIPGNHDVGDKPFPAMPGCEVDEAGLRLYRRHFGAPFSSFDHAGCHFVLINAPVLNSGLAAEDEQRAWLEADLAAAAGSRIFLFTHYPPYLFEPGEPSNYDNIDEPARSWLLSLIERHAVEAVFAGHVHNFLYHRHGRTDLYVLPATSLFRQDYAELFPVETVAEYGRADARKLGFALVDVFDDGHVVRHVRTGGRTLAPGATLAPEPARVRTFHPRERMPAPLGVHLRHPWAEPATFPYNGPMDEFVRKRARNDHPLLALWECGVRRLRVPFGDLADVDTRARMAALREMGHGFDVFLFGLPSGDDVALLARHRDLVEALEVVLPRRGDAARAVAALAALRARTGLPILLSKVESSARRPAEGSTFRHFVSFGFRLSERGEIEELLALEGARAALDGLVFRLALDESPWMEIPRMVALAATGGVRAVVNVRLASDEPTEHVDDDRWIANRVAEALAAAFALPAARVFLDTLVDQDRGNYPRHGLIDRRSNPRPASFVLRHLQAAMIDLGGPFTPGEPMAAASWRLLPLDSARALVWLGLPERPVRGASLPALPAVGLDGNSGTARWVDLMSGAIGACGWWRTGAGSGLVIDPPLPAGAPLLLAVPRAPASAAPA